MMLTQARASKQDPPNPAVEMGARKDLKLFQCVVDGLSYRTEQDVSAHLRFAHSNTRYAGSMIRERIL